MRILHIASFQGNLGDILNHQNFYRVLKEKLCCELEVKQIEIREFYKNSAKRKFDLELSEYINSFQMLLIGGGGFFDVHWDYSSTATTLDMPEEFIDSIQVPVVINALSYMEFKKTPELFIKFERFITKIIERNWFISLRNDGSYERMKKRFPKLNMNKIIEVPDNVFTAVMSSVSRKIEGVTVGMSLTDDLFDKEYNCGVGQEMFLTRVTEYVKRLLDKKYNIVFFIHTPQDVMLISKILPELSDLAKRKQVILSPLDVHDDNSVGMYESYYRMCDVMVAMRFHVNIFALSNNIPCVALAGHARIEGLYHSLNLDELCIPVNNIDFIESLDSVLNKVIENLSEYRNEDKMIQIRKWHEQYMTSLQEYIVGHVNG